MATDSISTMSGASRRFSPGCSSKLQEIDHLIRSGHLEVAVERLSRCFTCADTVDWHDLVRYLRNDGLVPEAALLDAMAGQPAVFEVIPRLRWLAGLVALVFGVALATQMGALALLPALSLGVLIFESQRRRMVRQATPDLQPAERGLVSDYLDLAIYLAGELRLTRWVMAAIVLVSLACMAGGLHFVGARGGGRWIAGGLAFVGSGLVVLVAAIRAWRRVRDFELRRPFPSFRRPVGPRRERSGPVTKVASADSGSPLRIGFPTPGRTALVVVIVLVGCGVVASVVPSWVGVAGFSLVAVFTLLRACNTSLVVDDHQLRIDGVFVHRTISIAGIQSARTPATAKHGMWVSPRLDVVLIDERTRTVAVAGLGARPSADFTWPANSRSGRIVAAAARINAARSRRLG